MSKLSIPVINGWTIFAHPLFLDQVEELISKVESLRLKDPINFKKKNVAKRLAAINELAFVNIPKNPASAEYRQGKTLGDEHKHWFRAKFFQQYRLFFRFHTESGIIIYAWVNDEDTKRAYGNKADAYSVFQKMLKNNRPPDNWDTLVNECITETSRLNKITKLISS